MAEFMRFSESILVKEDLRVTAITIKPIVADSTGDIWFTDLMLQEGDKLTGFVINQETTTQKMRDADGEIEPPRHYNGLIRNSMTAIVFNLGTDTAGLDMKIYPNDTIVSGELALSQGSGGQQVMFLEDVGSGDELSLLASSRECLKNEEVCEKQGFYQYSASGDSKHNFLIPDKTSLRVVVEFQEMERGDEL